MPPLAKPDFTEPKTIHEFGIAGDETKFRNHCLQTLIAKGWQPSGETSAWDLEKDGSHVLIATERCGPNLTHTLFRVSGDPDAAQALERELRSIKKNEPQMDADGR